LHKEVVSAEIECKKGKDQLQSAIVQKCMEDTEKLQAQWETDHNSQLSKAITGGESMAV